MLIRSGVVTVDMDEDYSSEDSDYEFHRSHSNDGSAGDAMSPNGSATGAARTPRKSRKTRMITIDELAASGVTGDVTDVIPQETHPVDPRLSTIHALVPPPPVPSTSQSSSPKIGPGVPPPKPPRRSSVGSG